MVASTLTLAHPWKVLLNSPTELDIQLDTRLLTRAKSGKLQPAHFKLGRNAFLRALSYLLRDIFCEERISFSWGK